MEELLEFYLRIAYVNDVNVEPKDICNMIEHHKAKKDAKCILLVRVSTEGQDLTQQTEKVMEEALKDGYVKENIIVLEDKESAIKLSEAERNGLNKLKWHIKNDKIDCVYVYEVSRISRQPATLYHIRDFLRENQVQLVVLNPYMKMLKDDGTMSETANIFFGIFSSMAENEMYIKKQRMKRGRDKKKELGLHAGGNPAIGYAVDKTGHFIIDEEGASMVRRIFNEYANGISIRSLARELQAEGWRSKTAFLTVCQSLLNILHREYYCGNKTYPQIISRELFDKCAHIAKNKLAYNKQYTKEALLKGIIRDMETGYIMSGNMSAESMQYYCKRYGKTTISMKAADMLIGGLAEEWYSVIAGVKIDEMRQSIRTDIQRQKNIVKQQEKNITDNQDKIDRITEMYIDGKFSKERAEAKQKQIFESMQYYKKTLKDAQDKIVQLTEELKNSKPHIHSLRDKILYVIDSIYVRRISRFVCEIKVTNKWTGEVRTYEYNTRKCIVLKMTVKMRDTLNYIP